LPNDPVQLLILVPQLLDERPMAGRRARHVFDYGFLPPSWRRASLQAVDTSASSKCPAYNACSFRGWAGQK